LFWESNRFRDSYVEAIQEQNHFLQRRVVITPTMVLVKARDDEETNHVLRSYKYWIENFLRVVFANDDSKCDFYSGPSYYLVLDEIYKIIKNGICILDFHFTKLSYSSS